MGDKIGVGFRAVSKWERGLTLPDIGNINELSKILGITSDELLTGELNKDKSNKDKRKIPPIIIKIAIPIIALLTIIISISIYYNNKTYVYSMINASDEYYIEGQVTFKGSNITIMVNKFDFIEKELASTVIKNYEYEINSGEENLIRYGYIYLPSGLDKPISIKEFMRNFSINYTGKIDKRMKSILKDNITIDFIFLDEYDNEITKKINVKINKK